ncbi:GtrA family protein [Gandjariella thermophila]|uniref:Sugar translocase n=1 Tax=Gandjariella thermophila TaxID=1931992 RepID=A0A4D4JBP8_9PSEU|nr:GtrA family protein [Gandjariella thermophila]GDY31347.1 sugar translocase [Gandjariella thermophila]
MPPLDTALARVPEPVRSLIVKHQELLKFAVVGGTTFVIDNGVWWALKTTVLDSKPVTAKAIGVLVATIASYVLSREWSFRTRGGRERAHEAALFFLISGIGVGINLVPVWISRYVLHLQVPTVGWYVQEIADFVSGSMLGMLLAMVFRFWAFRKWVFPQENARPRRAATVLRAVRSNSDNDSERVA